MFNLILNKIKKNKQNKKNTNTNKEKIEIDYDKLTKAIINANIEIQKQQEQKKIEEYENEQISWKKSLLGENYKNKKENALNIFLGIIKFNKKNATHEKAIYALLRICIGFFLSIYEWLFYGLASIVLLLDIFYIIQSLINFSSFCLLTINILFSIIIFFIPTLLFIVAKVIKIANFESEKTNDKDTIVILFNAIISFTAMMFAIIAVIITIIKEFC